MHVHTHRENEISRGRMGFWGYRGSRACDCAAMCVRARSRMRVFAHMLLKVSECVCVFTAPQKQLSDVTQTDACLLPGFSRVHGNLFMNTWLHKANTNQWWRVALRRGKRHCRCCCILVLSFTNTSTKVISEHAPTRPWEMYVISTQTIIHSLIDELLS